MIGWENITAETIGRFAKNKFELFVRELIDWECARRWSAEGPTIEGPSAPDSADGDRDIFVYAHRTADESAIGFREQTRSPVSLVGDLVANVGCAISCKSGGNCAALARKDARDGGVRVLEVLRNGGRFVVAMNAQLPEPPPRQSRASRSPRAAAATKVVRPDPAASVPQRTALARELSAIYAQRLKVPRTTAASLEQRIDVIDADMLARYVRATKPVTLSRWILELLDVRYPGPLVPYDRWVADHQQTRFRPEYQRDGSRRELLTTLNEYLSPGDGAPSKVLVVRGAPGVGKSRLVMEAIEDARLDARTLASNVVDDVFKALDPRLLESQPDGVFIADECPAHRVGPLAQLFRDVQRDLADRGDRARLVVISPGIPRTTFDEGPQLDELHVLPLDRDARLALIHEQLGTRVEDLSGKSQKILEATGGYPWFAVLAAREVREGAPAPLTSTDAARLALASRDVRDADPNAVVRRARALLAMVIADNPIWRPSDADLESLARAVDLSGRHELESLLNDCIARGILRSGRRRYVTPAILEREVWRIAAIDGGDGPILRRIREHYEKGLEPLLARLETYGMSANDESVLLREIRADLTTLGGGIEALARPGVGQELLLAAKARPELAAQFLVRPILDTPFDALRAARRARRGMVHGLTALAQHDAWFDAAESALFKLRLAENEAYANNATAVWSWLFLPWLDMTGVAFEHRFERLAARCHAADVAERLAATTALADFVSRLGVMVVGVESRTPVSTAECLERLHSYWKLLCELSRDDEPTVADAAQEIFVEHLRPAIDAGWLDPLHDEVLASVARLGEARRVLLRREIDFERSASERSSVMSDAFWAQLDAATAPHTFPQRLRDRLGLYMSTAFLEGATAHDADARVVHEGLASPDYPLLNQLDDFERPEAQRAGPVMIVVGELDGEARLVEPIVQRLESRGGDAFLLSTYCAGHSHAARRDLVDSWIQRWRHDDALGSAVVEVIIRSDPDDGWLDTITALLARGRVASSALRYLDLGEWSRTSKPARYRLYAALLEHGGKVGVQVVINRLGRTAAPIEPIELELLERAFALASTHDLNGGDAWHFHRAGSRLLEQDRVTAVVESALDAASREHLPADDVWQLLEECAERDPTATWRALRSRLDQRGPASDGLVGRLGFREVWRRLPASSVLEWVGTNARRGAAVASGARFDDSELSLLVRELVSRFGAKSSIAAQLSAAMISTHRPVSSLLDFYEAQVEKLDRWLDGTDPAVREWLLDVRSMVVRLRDAEREDEALERRLTGT